MFGKKEATAVAVSWTGPVREVRVEHYMVNYGPMWPIKDMTAAIERLYAQGWHVVAMTATHIEHGDSVFVTLEREQPEMATT